MLMRPSDPPERTDSKGEKEALDAVHQARETLEKARAGHIQAVFDYGYEVGWNVGFDRGWDAAFESMQRQEASLRAIVKAERPPEPPRSVPLPTLAPPKHLTAAELVAVFISQFPGARGVDIANHFAENPSASIPERTIRTALHRLKKAGSITIEEGRWYPAHDGKRNPQEERKLL